MYKVYLESGHGTRYEFISFDTEVEAVEFCDRNCWSWFDENEFEWNLAIREY